MMDLTQNPNATAINSLVEKLDIQGLLNSDIQKRELMNVLTVLQAGHLLDVFTIQSTMSQYVKLAVQTLYNPDLIIAGEDDPVHQMAKLKEAMSFMQKYMVYAQKFTQGNQELLVPKERQDKEDAVVKLLSSLQGEKLDEVINLLEGLREEEQIK